MVVNFKPKQIVTKFAVYVAWILLCESYKFGEKIYYSNWNNEFFLRDCFLLAHPVYAGTAISSVLYPFVSRNDGVHSYVTSIPSTNKLIMVASSQRRRDRRGTSVTAVAAAAAAAATRLQRRRKHVGKLAICGNAGGDLGHCSTAATARGRSTRDCRSIMEWHAGKRTKSLANEGRVLDVLQLRCCWQRMPDSATSTTDSQ